MGKVGSSTLKQTLLQRHRGLVCHAHRYADLADREKLALRWRRRLNLPVLVVSPVRDPLSRNVSAFFQTFRRDTGLQLTDRDWTTPELLNLFLQRYPHQVCLDWFDVHFYPTFHIDIFDEPFPVAQKWQIYQQGAVRLLVYRTDLPHESQAEILSRFLGTSIVKLDFDNVAENKEYAALYRQFCQEVILPEDYVSRMAESRYFRHFWSSEEIGTLSRKWRKQ